MADYRVETVLDIKADLGECAIWSMQDQALCWLDITARTFNRFDPRGGGNTAWPLLATPGCFALREGGAVVAAQDAIYDLAFETGQVTRLAAAAHDATRFRANDGRSDRQGRLLFGTMPFAFAAADFAASAYYRYDGGGLTKVLDGVGVANGTAFTADGRTMFRAQSETRRIFAYDYDVESGTPSNPRVFAVVPEELGVPDGATVDAEGGYWAALPAPPPGQIGRVARFAPDGRLDICFETPAPMPTMVAFGGPDLSILYITSGRLSDHVPYEPPPMAGGIFAVETGFRGVAEALFRA